VDIIRRKAAYHQPQSGWISSIPQELHLTYTRVLRNSLFQRLTCAKGTVTAGD